MWKGGDSECSPTRQYEHSGLKDTVLMCRRFHRAHSMQVRDAYKELYVWMTAFLDEKWGRGGVAHHR